MAGIKLIRGDTDSIKVTMVKNGNPIDLTGATVFFTAKPALTADSDDSSAVMAVKVTDHLDPTHGITVIPLTSTVTTVTPGKYFYDIQVKDADGNIISSHFDKLEVIADVTRKTT